RRALGGSSAGPGHVAVILDGKAELIENAANPCGAQRVRPHQGSELRGPDLDGDAEQGDARCIGVRHEATFRRIAGWAKRSVPTIPGNGRIEVGTTQMRLCPPYKRAGASTFRYALK